MRMLRNAVVDCRQLTLSHRVRFVWRLSALMMIAAAGCSESPTTQPQLTPAVRDGAATQTAPTGTQPGQADDETQREIQPPQSRYDSKPPYPVELYVLHPDDEQPGWLQVLKLDEEGRPAQVRGTFPERNLMIVDTQNVRRIDIHVGHLPMDPSKRIMLRIDGQGIELRRGKGEFITLEKSPAGAWSRIGDH